MPMKRLSGNAVWCSIFFTFCALTFDFGSPAVAQSTHYRAERARKVEVLVASWCGYCQKLEQYLKEQNIPYTRLDIEKSAKGRRRYNELGRGGVPIVTVGSEVIRGYEPEAVKAAYDR